MKKRASGILKEIIAALQSMAKAKKTFQALKNKTNAIKARIVIFSLLNNKKSFLINSISQKFQGLVGLHEKHHCDDVLLQDDQDDKPIVSYSMNNAICNEAVETGLIGTSTNITSVADHNHQCDDDHDGQNNNHDDQVSVYYYNKNEEKYPDLTHTLFEEDDDDDLAVAGGGSVIDLVKNSKEEAGEEFRLEDEIDQVADLFIRKFHRQIRYQKQQSFKRYKEMLQRSA
ncbi:hypothetical protein UlMin_020928 [Ulmus minor]